MKKTIKKLKGAKLSTLPFYLHNQTHFKAPITYTARRPTHFTVRKRERERESIYIITMRGREGAPPTDLLVCFPSRTRLALMPKPVSSPSRAMDHSSKQHRSSCNNKQLVKSGNRGGYAHHGQASPLLWAKAKHSMESDMDEPTSPKVTCAGQIKVKSMGGIERLHYTTKHKKKKMTWVEALGLKKDVTQFLSCLRGIKLDLPCFGSFHQSVISSDDDDEDEEEDEEKECQEEDSASSKAVFSKWFMVLEETQKQYEEGTDDKDEEGSLSGAPPPNALLLMRCRSAPAKTWLEEKQLQEQVEKEEAKKANLLDLEEKKNEESVVFKYYAPDFFKVSSDIAKETWVVGGVRDPLSRSRSWKR